MNSLGSSQREHGRIGVKSNGENRAVEADLGEGGHSMLSPTFFSRTMLADLAYFGSVTQVESFASSKSRSRLLPPSAVTATSLFPV
jgi:hypothetical protein